MDVARPPTGGETRTMQIAGPGTRAVGRTPAPRFAELGHTVVIGTRDRAATAAKEEYAAWAADHPEVGLATFAAAAEPASLVVNATNGDATLAVLAQAGELGGKIV